MQVYDAITRLATPVTKVLKALQAIDLKLLASIPFRMLEINCKDLITSLITSAASTLLGPAGTALTKVRAWAGPVCDPNTLEGCVRHCATLCATHCVPLTRQLVRWHGARARGHAGVWLDGQDQQHDLKDNAKLLHAGPAGLLVRAAHHAGHQIGRKGPVGERQRAGPGEALRLGQHGAPGGRGSLAVLPSPAPSGLRLLCQLASTLGWEKDEGGGTALAGVWSHARVRLATCTRARAQSYFASLLGDDVVAHVSGNIEGNTTDVYTATASAASGTATVTRDLVRSRGASSTAGSDQKAYYAFSIMGVIM